MCDRVITPGDRKITVISALLGGDAEKVLCAIGAQDNKARPIPLNNRQFEPWSDNVCKGKVTCFQDGTKIEVTLKLGVQEGLFLRDDLTRVGWSGKPVTYNSCLAIPIGRLLRSHVQESERERTLDTLCWTIANQIIGTFVVHGFNWMNCKGELIPLPCGLLPSGRKRSRRPRRRQYHSMH